MNDSQKPAAIRQRMQELRYNLDEDVQSSFENAQSMMSWRYYFRTYPWLFLGAAMAGGYLIVRLRGSRTQPSTLECSASIEQKEPLAPPKSPPSGNAPSLRNSVLSLVGNLVINSVASYAAKEASTFFAHLVEESDAKKHRTSKRT